MTSPSAAAPRADIAVHAASVAAALIVAFLVALKLPHIAGTGLAIAVLAAFGVIWLPVSLVLLIAARRRQRDHAAEESALQAQRQLEIFLATRRDGLTGLQSRVVFLDALTDHVAQSRAFGLLLIDLDRFGMINGMHGDKIGNEILRAFADRLRTIAGKREHVARLDGDEFALLLDAPEELRDIDQAAMRVLRRLSEPYPAAGQLLDLTASMGIALSPQHGNTAEAILNAARSALDNAKAAGRATWRLCGKDISERLLQRDSFRGELIQAIETGCIIPYYQPIVRLPSGEVAKFEVLARWAHPKEGLLTPDRFIPLAEELGLSGQVSMSLMRHVAVDSAHWPDWCRFAINVSAGQMRDLIGFIRNQPGDWQRRMDLSRLDVEITENALLYDRTMAQELIAALHDMGARAGLDNFGSGYSNLSHLRDMPFDSIKIGKEFIQKLLVDARAEACVMSMLWLGHGLGIDMVADGVEDEETAARLATMGCHFAQGFLYARPTPASGAREMLNLPALPQAQAAE
jgi:diguanylate cyclase (GGDEF)-like protein